MTGATPIADTLTAFALVADSARHHRSFYGSQEAGAMMEFVAPLDARLDRQSAGHPDGSTTAN